MRSWDDGRSVLPLNYSNLSQRREGRKISPSFSRSLRCFGTFSKERVLKRGVNGMDECKRIPGEHPEKCAFYHSRDLCSFSVTTPRSLQPN